MNNIQEHKDYVTSQIEKAFGADIEKAHKVGDQHPNGKWVWTEYKPGKFDWRPPKKKNGVEQKKTEQGGGEPQAGKKSLDEHAADASTEALKKVAESPNAGADLKAAAQKELKNRGEKSDESTDEKNETEKEDETKKEITLSSGEHKGEKYYIWKDGDNFKGSKENPDNRVTNANLVSTFKSSAGFKSIADVEEYVNKYF